MSRLDEASARLDAAAEVDRKAAAEKALGADTAKTSEQGGLSRWMTNLPKNIGVGLIDAALNTLDATDSIGDAKPEPTPHEKRMAPSDAVPPVQQLAMAGERIEHGELSGVREAAVAYRNLLAQGGKTSDVITQSASQFVIPFLGWSKAFTGLKAAANAPKLAQTAGKVGQAAGAEAATLATAFDPHGGRLADLVEFGKQTEGRFADVLNTIAPDGSAINAYIDYMTDRGDEGDLEGRFKNVIDGLAGSAAVGGLLSIGAKTFRGARNFADSQIVLPDIGAPNSNKNIAAVIGAPPPDAPSMAPRLPDFEDEFVEMRRRAAAMPPAEPSASGASIASVIGDVPADAPPLLDRPSNRMAAEAFKLFEADPRAALVHLTEQADDALDDSVHAEIKDAANIVSQRLPQKGISVVPTEQGHTVVVGRQPLLTFMSPEDAQTAITGMRQQFGAAFETRAAAEHAKASDKNFATLHSFSRVLQTNMDRPVSTHSLLSALEKNLKGDTEQGAFYKELLGRLVRKKLGGFTNVKATAPSERQMGGYDGILNNINLYPRAFQSPAQLLHTYAHEAVHAATMHEMNASARVLSQMESVRKAAVTALTEAWTTLGKSLKDFGSGKPVAKAANSPAAPDANLYGFTNAYEFVAEIESNPEFRQLMQKTKLPDGGTAWDKYLETIAGILGVGSLVATPEGLKEFSKLMMGPKQEEKPSA